MIYCKQVPPEYQESPIFQADMFPENMVVCGNRDFKEWKTAVLHWWKIPLIMAIYKRL